LLNALGYHIHNSSEFKLGYVRLKVLNNEEVITHFEHQQVFKMLWSEPAGETSNNETVITRDSEAISIVKHGEKVHSSIRRFVIVKEYPGHCLCL
jgi:hypothetical protein